MTTTKSYDALNRPTSIVSTNATVTLWSADSLSAVTPTYRKGEYFRGELAFANQPSAIYATITNLAVLNNGTNADIISTNIGRAFVPRTPEAFAHDADGNLTNDARWTYTWDASPREITGVVPNQMCRSGGNRCGRPRMTDYLVSRGRNRLTSFTRPGSGPEAAKVKVDCQYDSRGRRTQKVVSSWNGSAYVAQSTNRFLYDGWNLVGLFDAQSSLLQSFTWGTDLSGTMQGAGGVGGLKSMTVHSGSLAGTYSYCYDGNGNVRALVSAADGSVAAEYEYGPFGEVIRATGPLAQVNPFLFSTKFCDAETGFYYYGYRYYDASTGRWPNRDPIEELGGLNLYGAIENDPVNSIDPLGESTLDIPAGEKDGVKLTIQIVTDDKTCQVVGINMLRKGGIDVYVWKFNLSGNVAYQVNCSFYNTSGGAPFNFVYEKNPPPAWLKRKLAKTEPVKESGTKEIPLCCSCKLNVTWDVSGQITVVPGTIEDPTPPKPPKK